MDAQRAAILGAAVELLAERGYAACSMAAVAAEAGVATGSVYRHFPGKADLAAELFRTLVTREVEAVERAVASADTAAEKVVAVVETFATRALKAPRRAFALLAEPVGPVIDAERLEFRRTFRDVVARCVRDGVRDGSLPAQDAELAAAAIVGAVAEVMIGPLSPAGRGFAPSPAAAIPSADADAIGRLAEFTLRALGAGDASHA